MGLFKKFRRDEDMFIEEIDSEILMSYESYLRSNVCCTPFMG